MRILFPAIATILVFPLSMLLGCGGGSGGTGKLQPDQTKFDVTWGPSTKVVEETAGKAHLTGPTPGPDTMTYTFDAGASAIAALDPGDIAVLAGIAYRKVVAVNTTATGIELVTERTTLPQAIKKGTIEWARTVDFDDLASLQDAQMYVGDRRMAVRDMLLGLPLTYEGDVHGYHVSLTLTPSMGRLEATAEVSLMVAGEKRFAVEGTGHIETFQGTGHAVVGEGGLLEFRAGANQLRGEAHVKAAAFNTDISDELLDVPMGIDVPIQAGPVPLILKIKANVNVRLILGVVDSSAEAEVGFQFSSTQGISLSGVELTSTGSLGSGSLSDFAGGAADAVTAGMSACLEFPRFELTMLGEFASVGFTQNNCAETFFSFQPACNEVNGTITGIALANLGFFGVTLASGTVELYTRTDGRMLGMCD